MMTYTGADLIADGLATLGVEHVFGIVSIHNMPIFDAINRLGKTRIIDVRHEQGGTHAADGYARATGKLGVMIASTGPQGPWVRSRSRKSAADAANRLSACREPTPR
jgi:acetolactate synthase-1/2/3 large subunit